MGRLIARLADHPGDRLACTVNLVESLPRSIQADIKVFFGSQANALMEARRLSSTPSGALRPPIIESSAHFRADSLDCGDDKHRDQTGDQRVLDCRHAVLIANEVL